MRRKLRAELSIYDEDSEYVLYEEAESKRKEVLARKARVDNEADGNDDEVGRRFDS